ncbi:MAG: hypothetical protein ABIT01_15720 [Thermoanaerobaculia bacterium]
MTRQGGTFGRDIRVVASTFLAIGIGAGSAQAATITFAGDRGAGCLTFVGTSGGNLVIPVTGTVAAGSKLIITAGSTGNASGGTVTDTGSNSYTAVNSFNSPPPGRAFQVLGTIATGLTAASTVTLPFVSSANGEIVCASLHAFTNVTVVNLATGNAGNSTTPGSTMPALSAQPNELLVGTYLLGAASGGLSSPDIPLSSASSGTFSVNSIYRIVSATGIFSYSATIGTSQAWTSVFTSFQDAQFPVELQKIKIE